jgi:hypothetical protein
MPVPPDPPFSRRRSTPLLPRGFRFGCCSARCAPRVGSANPDHFASCDADQIAPNALEWNSGTTREPAGPERKVAA